jgi:hypothetical protein
MVLMGLSYNFEPAEGVKINSVKYNKRGNSDTDPQNKPKGLYSELLFEEFDVDNWMTTKDAQDFLLITASKLEYLAIHNKIKFQMKRTNLDGRTSVRKVYLRSDVIEYQTRPEEGVKNEL